MTRRTGIAGLLIGLFALNGVLCPCGPMPVAETPDVVNAAVAHHHAVMAHASAGEDADATGMADCHSDSTGDDCGMADAGNPDVTGSYADRLNDPAKATAIATLEPNDRHKVQSTGFVNLGAGPRPLTTPIRNRDRLMI